MRYMSQKQVRAAVSARVEFDNDSVAGTIFPSASTGNLNFTESMRYLRDLEEGRIAYVVVNRATPIAWVRFGGAVVIPSCNTRKQTELVRALNI